MNGTFEDKLLGELKQIVAERAAEPAPRRSWRPRLVATAGVAAALGLIAAVGIPVLTGGRTSPAWAVTPDDDGWVIVTINDYRDADGLERQLEDAGVRAEVDFIPGGQMCAKEPRFQATENESALQWLPSEEDKPRFRVRPEAFRPDESMVISTSLGELDLAGGARIEWSGLGVSVAKGPVIPCELVPDPHWTPIIEKVPAQKER